MQKVVMLLINLGVLLVFLVKIGIVCGQVIHGATQRHSWKTQVGRKESKKLLLLKREKTNKAKTHRHVEPTVRKVEPPGSQKMLKGVPTPRNGQKTHLRITPSEQEGSGHTGKGTCNFNPETETPTTTWARSEITASV